MASSFARFARTQTRKNVRAFAQKAAARRVRNMTSDGFQRVGPIGSRVGEVRRLDFAPGGSPPPGPGSAPPGGGGGGGIGDIADLGCTFLSGRAREICEGAVDVLFPGGNGGGGGGGFAPGDRCPKGKVRFGNKCVDPMAALPGGDPLFTDAGGVAVQGAFGMPAIVPNVEERIHRTCPAGMVLGDDNLCYPKAILGRRNRFRKWRQPPRPPITRADQKAIRRAEKAKKKIKSLGKDVGLKVTKR